MKMTFLILLIPIAIWAQDCVMDNERDEECRLMYAQERFNPWYSGPLLVGGAHMMDPGSIGIQAYVFGIDNYAQFDSNHNSVGYPYNIIQYKPVLNAIQAGVTSWLDLSLALQTLVTTQQASTSGGFGDLIVTAGFQALEEGPILPAIKLGIGEIFPTGRYQNLNANKGIVDALGQGSYQTTFSLRIAKIFLWSTCYPVNLRLTTEYIIPTTTHVHHFNAYGGGYGTQGKVRLGNQFNLSFGMEFSFAEGWVIGNDLVYVCNSHSPFSGTVGVDAVGNPAVVGLPSNDQLSLCPVIEYNDSSRLGILAGIWFSVYGRNTYDFIGGILGMNYTFQVD